MKENNKIFATVLTSIQLSSLVFLLISGQIIAVTTEGLLVEIAGVILGFHAIFTQRIGNFNIRPLPKQGAKLITSGPYSLIRHPMYTAQILALIPLVIEHFTYLRLAVLIILSVVLIIKINFEEKQLVKQFENYNEYRKKSKKLIPFIF